MLSISDHTPVEFIRAVLISKSAQALNTFVRPQNGGIITDRLSRYKRIEMRPFTSGKFPD